MKKDKKDYIWLAASVMSFLLLAVSFLLMPLEVTNTLDGFSIINYLAGIIFWLSIILIIITQIVAAKRRKKWLNSNGIKKVSSLKTPGIISFFRNIYGVVADIMALISLIGFIAFFFITNGTGYICYVFIALFIFSFGMHCIFNGKSFFVITNKDKIMQILQKERTNQSQNRKEKSK